MALRGRTLTAFLAAVAVAALPAGSAHGGSVSPARALRICAAAGPFWPTMTLAVRGTTAWVACKTEQRLLRLDLRTGRRTATLALDAPAIAVAASSGAVWALDGASTLYRVDPVRARVVRRIALGTAAAYNIWLGGGSVWVADDQGAQVVRVSPKQNRVTARIPVGDGPADLAFGPARAWVIDHRDRTLYRIDLATNRARRLATVAGDAPERLARLGARLWVTGRGTQLLEVDPETGAQRRAIALRGTGIDVVSAAGALWVPVRSFDVDRSGFPTMTALRRVTSAGALTTRATATGRVDVHGLAAADRAIWLADTTGGVLYRVSAS